MENILKDIVDMVMENDYCHHHLNREMEQEAQEHIDLLNEWLDETFPDWRDNDEACSLIFTAMFYRERWMLANGIAIGLSLADRSHIFENPPKQ